ncbi:hypothetical protein [Streptomyces sp. RKAG293]|uniref:hypothetical protein n=1 Tax=Streptomyces sp. RKAG293 TaxID=2893403 RepID=UPI002034911B|nr:hypothetical protein [Streptomyces sp. RKAG293]MCM2420290.1 hypothetical protein [Streptomyces sp. RKAG293]
MKPAPSTKELLHLVDRGAEGRLLPVEAELLRAGIRRLDGSRRSAGGAQATVSRLRWQLAAAEQAIVETEADRDRLAQQAAAERRRSRAEAAEQEQRAELAEAALAAVRAQLAEAEAAGLRYANYLAAAQRACGAPNWPALADTIRDRIHPGQAA